jgi:hypothetical protein
MIPNVKALLQAEIVDALRAQAANGGAPPGDSQPVTPFTEPKTDPEIPVRR